MRNFRLLLLLLLPMLMLGMTSCEKNNPTPPPPSYDGRPLPIVFHVLYEDASDPVQNAPAVNFKALFNYLNKFYAGTHNPSSTPIGIQFKLAETAPDGTRLAEPGIHRYAYPNATGLDIEAFLYSKHPAGSDNANIFWDPNEYINIWICGFYQTPEEAEQGLETTGIAFLPYNVSSTENALPGLTAGAIYQKTLPTYMHGIALNNRTVFTDDGPGTTVHEVGHYLGLFHAFDEKNTTCTSQDDAGDDYCSDTPKYIRSVYMTWVYAEMANETLTWENAIQRTSCKGTRFTSTNVMDYFYSYRNAFTPEQKARIVHVLEYSPLIPRASSRTGIQRPLANPADEPTPILIR